MTEVYRKIGRVVRYESGRLVRVTEAGEASEDGAVFTCKPSGARVDLPEIDADAVRLAAMEVESVSGKAVRIERCVLTEGIARHTLGSSHWTDKTRRVHLSLAAGRLRALVDRGDFDLSSIEMIASALARAGDERTAPQRLRLRPAVSAALIPSLVGTAPPNVTLVQVAGGLDGKGLAIEERTLGLPPWPNWFRPSYRVRPAKSPLNVAASPTQPSAGNESLPEAIALLAPVDGLSLRVLIVDGKNSYPATVRVTRIESVGDREEWYPYAAGSFGAEMVL
jgi:hypothetical protein